MPTDPTPLRAAADQALATALDGIDALARELGTLDHHVAADKLAAHLQAHVPADVIANALANLALTRVRTADMPPLDQVTEPFAGKPLTPEIAGVEVRLIGPEPAVRRTLALIDAKIGLVGFRGPAPATRITNGVRFYAYTDPAAARDHRNRGGRRDRNRAETPQEG